MIASFAVVTLSLTVLSYVESPHRSKILAENFPKRDDRLHVGMDPELGSSVSSRKLSDQIKLRKILSLDGGGVRGLSIIMILKYIMKRLNRARGFSLHPWQEFDMIGGTSTGG